MFAERTRAAIDGLFILARAAALLRVIVSARARAVFRRWWELLAICAFLLSEALF